MPDEERIRRRAHEIWEREGRPEGRHEEHWARARREVESEEGGSPPGPGGREGDDRRRRRTRRRPRRRVSSIDASLLRLARIAVRGRGAGPRGGMHPVTGIPG